MTLIGITGGSGSGKTTVTNLINKNIENSIIINVDDFMHKYLDIHKDEIISKLNLNIKDKHWYNYIGSNLDDIKTWVNIIEPELEKSIKKVIEENEKDIDTIIIDWAFLPLLSVYKECNFSISVNCNLNIKLNRLKKRLSQRNTLNRWDNEGLLNRLKNTSLNEFGYTSTYNISNNGNLDKLKHNIDNILNIYAKEN